MAGLVRKDADRHIRGDVDGCEVVDVVAVLVEVVAHRVPGEDASHHARVAGSEFKGSVAAVGSTRKHLRLQQ